MKLIYLFTCLCSFQVFAGTAGTKNQDGSFKLTEKSVSTLGITFLKLGTASPWKVPASALVKIKFTAGVYRRFKGDITYVIVKILKTDQNSVIIEAEDLEAGDEVATSGVGFLRLTEADLNSETVDNCAH